eukprot:9492363-Pyramimonas_sp.AAC.2
MAGFDLSQGRWVELVESVFNWDCVPLYVVPRFVLPPPGPPSPPSWTDLDDEPSELDTASHELFPEDRMGEDPADAMDEDPGDTS